MQSENRDVALKNSIDEEKIINKEYHRKKNLCPICKTFFNSAESLKVHMQYQHEDISNRWNVSTPTTPMLQQSSSASAVVSSLPTIIRDIAIVTTSTTSNITTSLAGSELTTSISTNNKSENTDAGNKSNNSNNNSSGTLLNKQAINSLSTATVSTTRTGGLPTVSTVVNKKSQIDSENIQLGGIKLNYNNNNQQSNFNKSESNVNSTVSAAADSSDNQSTTPQPQSLADQHNSSLRYQQNLTPQYSSPQQTQNNLLPLAQDMHPYPAYMHGYDQFYHPPPPPPTGMDYATGTLYGNSQSTSGPPPLQDHKLMPASRYHPYLNNSSSHHHHHLQQQQQQMINHSNSGSTNGNNTNPSSSISNSSLSPRVVSSSSPTQNSMMSQQQQQQNSQDSSGLTQISAGQPTPSPSPKQCAKCGFVCSTDAQLSEHYSTVHGNVSQTDPIRSVGTTGSVVTDDMSSHYSYQPYIKEEPSSDILDLDSQKMVYPPTHNDSLIQQEQPLPSIHSMHPMHRPLMWGPDMHSGYMSQVDMKQAYYPSIKQSYPGIKQEYIGMKQSDYPPGPGFGSQLKIADYQQHTISPQNRADIKPFGTDIPSVNNPASSSPSEFPSTTTPQENGPQFRGFDPPTSSLPNNPGSAKATTWKSNEARRPKTYNCTACNKWFTSSGHLKRHYNTTLHKNAVKSSGQPDPATMPISAHHHPSRDPNSKHSRSRNNSHQQPPPAPPEPPTSPEYTPQYTPPPNGFSQQQQQFQPYQTGLHSSTSSNGHPNGQAGPSVQTSQPRGLLIISTMATSNHHLDQEDQVHNNSSQHQVANSSPREDLYNLQQEITALDSNSPNQQLSLEDLHQTEQQQQLLRSLQHQQLQQLQTQRTISHHHMHHLQDTIIPSPTIIHNTIMDQQQQYINPLDINTTTPITHTSTIIPSFQHLQPPVEHQNHTTIGNNDSPILSETQTMIHLDSFTNHSNPTTTFPSNFSLSGNESTTPFQNHILQQSSNGNLHVTNLNPSIVELHRLSGRDIIHNINSIQDNTLLSPYSPTVPDYLRQKNAYFGERSPQEADIPPPHQSATAPSISSYPYSPTISSSLDGINQATISSSTSKRQLIVKKSSSTKRKKTSSISSSSAGMTTPSPTGKIECSECDKEFAKICYLTQHNKTFHCGEQPYRCQKCGKRFHSEEAYEIHTDKHMAKEKPYSCDKCPKQFFYKTDLRRHWDVHTGFKAYICDTCSKGFGRKDHLRKHNDTHKPKLPKKKKLNLITNISKKKSNEIN